MKSPTKRSRRNDTPFSKEEEVWIILNCRDKTPNELRRNFILHFEIKNHKKVPHPTAFQHLVRRFGETGGVTGACKPDEFRFTGEDPRERSKSQRFVRGKSDDKSSGGHRKVAVVLRECLAHYAQRLALETIQASHDQPTDS